MFDKKIYLLQENRKKIDAEIEELKLKNVESLAKALIKITDIEKLDASLILGAVLKSIHNISDSEQEVLRNSGENFLKKYKILFIKKARKTKK